MDAQQLNNQQPNTDKWVILEAMGRNVVAGRYFIDNGLHRVDIPDVSPNAAPGTFIRSEWYGNGAIFRITPVTEEAARIMAKGCTIPEAIPWDVRAQLQRLAAPGEQLRLVARDTTEYDYDEDLDPEGDDFGDVHINRDSEDDGEPDYDGEREFTRGRGRRSGFDDDSDYDDAA